MGKELTWKRALVIFVSHFLDRCVIQILAFPDVIGVFEEEDVENKISGIHSKSKLHKELSGTT